MGLARVKLCTKHLNSESVSTGKTQPMREWFRVQIFTLFSVSTSKPDRQGPHRDIALANGEVLRQAILSAAENSDDAEPLGNNGHGEVYILRFPVETRRGSATVLTVCGLSEMAKTSRDLITCYIL
jgi:hypothetical protein